MTVFFEDEKQRSGMVIKELELYSQLDWIYIPVRTLALRPMAHLSLPFSLQWVTSPSCQ